MHINISLFTEKFIQEVKPFAQESPPFGWSQFLILFHFLQATSFQKFFFFYLVYITSNHISKSLIFTLKNESFPNIHHLTPSHAVSHQSVSHISLLFILMSISKWLNQSLTNIPLENIDFQIQHSLY